jgi:hypothetical protein
LAFNEGYHAGQGCVLSSYGISHHHEIVRLSPPERLALIAQQAELDRRLASFGQDCRDGAMWAALKAELEQRCP